MRLNDFIIDEKMKIAQAIKKIDENGQGIVFICKDDKKLQAVLSDGDIRRYILTGGRLEEEVRCIANYSPKSIRQEIFVDSRRYMKENRITAVPLLNQEGCIQKIFFLTGKEISNADCISAPVVIMAGGMGTRLYPYTQILPKPLIPIGKKTITEHIIERFERFDCKDITMIVNYKKKFIETYFAEENKYHIKFVEENEYYGTGGGLKLLNGQTDTFFMTNCDILLDADYADIYKIHKKNGNIITMVCAKKKMQIPYGTVQMDREEVFRELVEKPTFSFLVNTGFYVIEPEIFRYIPDNTFIHITDIIQQCKKSGENIGVYSVDEECWMDMGQMDELEKMKQKLEGTENV